MANALLFSQYSVAFQTTKYHHTITVGMKQAKKAISFTSTEGKILGHFTKSLTFSLLQTWANELPSQCLKITQNVAFSFFNFGIFHQFCPIESDLSGNTV